MTAKLRYVSALNFQCKQDPITVADGKFFCDAPFDGEIMGARGGHKVRGIILEAGTGAGTYTEVQLRNATQSRDYFTTKPKFNVNSADANGRAPLEGGVLCLQPSFKAGDRIWLDVDDIPGGSDSAIAFVRAEVEMWREVF